MKKQEKIIKSYKRLEKAQNGTRNHGKASKDEKLQENAREGTKKVIKSLKMYEKTRQGSRSCKK